MKKILLVTFAIFVAFNDFAQIDSVRVEQDFIFQNINKTLIPSGYLNEYGPEVVNKTWLTGVLSDSNYIYDIDVFNLLYNDIENSRLNTNVSAMLSLDSAQVYTDLARYDTSAILAIFSADYASLREDAIQQNLFKASGNQIFDVSGRSQSPYVSKHCFAAVPVLPQSAYDNEIRIGYQPLFYGNTGRVISSVKVDFLDGAGYQNIFSNGTAYLLTKSYSDSSGYKKFAVKVVYSNGATDECYTQQWVHVTLSGMQSRFVTLTPQEFNNPNHRIIPTSYLNVNPVIPWIYPPNSPLYEKQRFNQDMKIYVRYSQLRQGTALQNKIVKPLIVVEGYDITDASPLLKAKNYGLNDLINEWNNPKISAQFDINKKLDEEAGYDLIFIDYYTMRSVTENSDYLLQAIDWINSQKVNNAVGVREQNVVMGISMGGLVSRYALAKRTKETGTNSTETRQLITMDSPHEGANVPLGLQHFLYDLGEANIVKKLKKNVEELKAFYDLNEQPATQQQLILRVTDGVGNRVSNTFLAPGGIYRTMVDYTAPYQFLAVSNGSQCAQQVMPPGALILQRSGNVAIANWIGGYLFRNKYRLSVQVNALPAYGTQAQICSVVMERNIRLFLGVIGTGWHRTSYTSSRTSPANTIPWDGVPAGTKNVESGGSLSQSGTEPIGKENTFFGNLWRGVVGALILNVDYNITFPFAQKNFSFVPITSSLDVANVTSATFNQQFNYYLNGLNGSRANKFMAQEFLNGVYNIPHTDFTPRNSKWIYEEMQSMSHIVDCQDYCDLNAIPINGSDFICSCSTYTLNGIPSNATVTWSVAPAGIVSMTPNGNSVTLCKTTNGTITLTATITGACGNATITKSITVGTPSPTTGTYNSPTNTNESMVPFYRFDLTTSNPSCIAFITNISALGSTSVQWLGPNDPDIYWLQSGDNIFCNFSAVGQIAVFTVSSSNACGTTYTNYRFKCTTTSSCGITPAIVIIAPNPAKSTMNVSLVQNNTSKVMQSFQKIKIIDKMGNIKQNNQYPAGTKSTSVNISLLAPDIYTIQIFDGHSWYSEKFIKN
ncbi:MAG: hypothetical protein JSS98_12940 [Bacteroidetes bacterium]|nr:hypothetical protein [Bacteroidota bacterium]